MDPRQADYFSTLAVVAVTFVGFSTVFATFRQALGGTISKYDVLLTRNTPGNAVHAARLTILLFAVFLAFLFGLDLLPSEPSKPLARGSSPRQERPSE